MNLEKIFKQEIQKYLKPGERFAIAVSGGVDSMVLLHLIREFTPHFSWKPIVLHLNHKLRGREALKDESLVRSVAEKLELTFISTSQDVKRLSQKRKISIEEAGREARLAFFEKCSKKYRFKKIVLAHHEDDLIETVLMRLFRGTGIRGFTSMESVISLRGLTVVRPLLDFNKKTLQSFATKNSIPYRNDATNQDSQFFRNKVRLKIVPFLSRALGKQALDKLLTFRSHLALHQNFVEEKMTDAFNRHWKKKPSHFQVSRRIFLKLHPVLQYGTLAQAYKAGIGKTLEEKEWIKVQNVLRGEVKQVNLRENSFFSIKDENFYLSW